ncbi:hypothetical protein SL86_03938 [Klebsiella pneumoniae]|nr:hypothetical protein SL86_03938 [Klebsiella pneumoniae]
MPYPAYESSAGSNSVGPRKRSAAGQRVIERSSMKSPDAEKQKPAFWAGSLNSGARTRNRTKDTGIFGSNSVGPRKRSASWTSDTVPAVVPDGGINALSGLRVPHRFKQRRPAQAQRRRAIHIRHRTRGCAGWRHKCLIRPTGPPQVQTAPARASAAPPGDTHQTPYLRLCRMAA